MDLSLGSGDLIQNPPAIIRAAGVDEGNTNKNERLLELFNKLLKSQKREGDGESISRQLATLLNMGSVQFLGEGEGVLEGLYQSAIDSLNEENLAKFTKLALEAIRKEDALLKEFKDKKQLSKEDLFKIVKILVSNDKPGLGGALLSLATGQSKNDYGPRFKGPRGPQGPSSSLGKSIRSKAKSTMKQFLESSPWEKELVYKMNFVDESQSTKVYKSIHKSVETYVQAEERRSKAGAPLPLRSQFKRIVRNFGDSPAGAVDLLKLLPDKNRKVLLEKLDGKYFHTDEIKESTANHPFVSSKDFMQILVSETYKNYDKMLSIIIDKDPFLQKHPKLKQELKDKVMQLIISSGSKEELLLRIAELYQKVKAPSGEKAKSVILMVSSFSLLMEEVKGFIGEFYY